MADNAKYKCAALYLWRLRPGDYSGWRDWKPAVESQTLPICRRLSQDLRYFTIDDLPVGALIWNPAQLALYNSANELSAIESHYFTASGKPLSVGKGQAGTVSTYSLSQNYPNPFNPTTKINYSIPATGLVTLKVYNILGQEVANLFSGIKTAGEYIVTFDGSRLASGVYFYRLQAGNQMLVKKMVMLK